MFTRSLGIWTEQDKLTASDGAAGDVFGVAVAVDAATAVVVGAMEDDVGVNVDQGSAYVFVKSADASTTDFFLHGSGATANPPMLFLDGNASTNPTAKYKDSTSVNFNGGNRWKEIGTWTASPIGFPQTLTALSDLHVWLGLKNSDDQGTRFDLRAEVYKNSTLAASGETFCIQGITRNADLAREATTAFPPFAPIIITGAEQLKLKVLTRIGTNGAGAFCGGHSNAVGLRLYFDSQGRPSRFDATYE